MNPDVKTKKTIIEGLTIPYSRTLRYQDNLSWNGDVFMSNDNDKCPITTCDQYLPGCNTPITGISNMMFITL